MQNLTGHSSLMDVSDEGPSRLEVSKTFVLEEIAYKLQVLFLFLMT